MENVMAKNYFGSRGLVEKHCNEKFYQNFILIRIIGNWVNCNYQKEKNLIK